MNSDPAFLITGNFTLYWHGIIIALASLTGAFSAVSFRRKQIGGDGNAMIFSALFAIVFAFIGARAYFCKCSPALIKSFDDVMALSRGGYALPGAFLGAFLGICLGVLIERAPLGEMLDACTPAAALSICIGRIAAALSGEFLGGVVANDSLHFLPVAAVGSDGLYRKALFLWESVAMLLIAACFSLIFRKRYIERSFSNRSGDIFLLFTAVYFIFHGIFEQFRYDPLYFNVPRALSKLQTVPVTFAIGALFAAFPLAIFILRYMFVGGFRPVALWLVAACGLFYFGYFNIILRVDAAYESLNTLELIFSAIGLIWTSVYLFMHFTKRNKRTPSPEDWI